MIYAEQKFCRGPLARSFNSIPGARWVPNINISFSKKFGRDQAFKADYDEGRPDAFVFYSGKIICIECKAAFVRFYFSEWSEAQRKWREQNCFPANVPYYIALWISYQADKPKRNHGSLYLVDSSHLLQFDHKSISRSEASIAMKEIKWVGSESQGHYSVEELIPALFRIEAKNNG